MAAAKDLEIWTLSVPIPKLAGELAARAEGAGYDGIAFTDSQSLTGDVFAGLALAANATRRIGLATGVTNPVTRHPAATASAIATVHAISNGRAVLGIGRGDSALFQIGLEPAPLETFERFLRQVANYLRGGEVELDGFASRVGWIANLKLAPVPVDVAATGPKVIELSARVADRITFAVGANPEREPALTELYDQIAGLNPGLAPAALATLGEARVEPAELDGYAVPTLMIAGEHDQLFAPAALKDAAARIPGCRVVDFAGAGHSPYFEAAPRFNRIVAEFVAEHSAA